MCGIAGIILPDTFNNIQNNAESVVRSMIHVLSHRGPDGDGFYSQGPLALGMCRLSINDLEGGAQPLYNEKKTVAVFYNGEIYNYSSLRNELERDGAIFQTKSDGEVICHLYDRVGSGAFSRLDGMFAIALWDEESQTLLLARDIPGEKPLYYSVASNGLFAFASELSAFRCVPGLELNLSLQAVWDMPTFLWVPEPKTIYQEVNAIPRSHYLKVRRGKTTLHPFSGVCNEEVLDFSLASTKDVIDEIRHVVKSAVLSRLLSDVPIGTFLSGGLDSSIVATLAARELGRIDTFSIGFQNLSDPYHGDADESVQAALTATKIGSKHHSISVTADDFLDHLDVLNHHAGQPNAVSSGLGILSIAKAARDIGIKVLLSGDGADECFGGYTWYRYLDEFTKLASAPKTVDGIASFQNIGLPLEQRLSSLNATSIPNRLWGWHYYGHESEKKRLFSAEINSIVDSSLRIFDVGDQESWTPIDYIDHDRNFYLPNEMLSKVDRMTMAYSVEGRAPFVAPAVLRLAEKLNFEHMVSQEGVLKWSLRQAFANILPVEVIKRPKHGFNVPIDHWLKNEWSFLMNETFGADSQLRKRGWLSRDALKVANEMLYDSRRLNGHTLFSMIMLNRWLEHEAC
jgi:asparagine synthase (glutamine-hydrolysing)